MSAVEMDAVQSPMRASNSRVLIVGDMQKGLYYENILQRGNFRNISHCKDAISALQQMDKDTPYVLIMDAEMPDMDGYELAAAVRDIERSENRFTYIVLVVEESVHDKVEFTWQANVDAILTTENTPFRLVPQVMSGERISIQMNHLHKQNNTLQNKCGDLEAGQMLDPLTGLGNRRQAMRGMDDIIRQIEARGGAIAVVLVKIMDIKSHLGSHGEKITEELIVAVGEKIRRLVRPMDIVTYFDQGTFAVVMKHESLEHCKPSSYQRIMDSLAVKSFQTRAGFLDPDIRIGVCGASAETGPPKTAYLIKNAIENLSADNPEETLQVTTLNPFG